MKLSDEEIVERLLSNSDPAFEDFFFNRQCVPLLSKIRWDVFDNQVPLEELANEFLFLLKKDNWNKLRTFEYKSSLFGWLRIVAKRHFIAIEDDLMPKQTFRENEKVELNMESNSAYEIKKLLEKVAIPTYKKILRMMYLERNTDKEIRDELSVSEELYQKLKAKAEKHLINVIRNEGDICIRMFLKVTEKKIEPLLGQTDDPVEETETKIDLENLINLMPNERNRFIIHSLILKDIKVNEVANQLGISVENLYVLKNRAIKQLALLVVNEKKLWKR